MIQQSEWNQEQTNMNQKSQTQSICPISCFENKFENIKLFLEDLKQPSIEITDKEGQQIQIYITEIMNYLELDKALNNQKLYRNALIGLGNLLSIKFSVFRKQFLSQKFFTNFMEYFMVLSKTQDSQNFNMLIYPVFYLIVLIIYNADKQSSKILSKNLFSKRFVSTLSQFQLVQGNKIERYLPIIIAFIAKNLGSNQETDSLKTLTLNNLHFGSIEKNQFQLTYALRILINRGSFTLNEIRRHSILSHLTLFLKDSQSQQSTSMILEILKHILKRHQILGYQIVNLNFLSLLEKSYKINSTETLSLFQIVLPCIPLAYKQSIFTTHINALSKQQLSYEIEYNSRVSSQRKRLNLKELQSIKILQIVFAELNQTAALDLLEKVKLTDLIERIFGQTHLKINQKEESIVISLIGKIFTSLSKINESYCTHIARMISCQQNNTKLKVLINFYKQKEYNNMSLE